MPKPIFTNLCEFQRPKTIQCYLKDERFSGMEIDKWKKKNKKRNGTEAKRKTLRVMGFDKRDSEWYTYQSSNVDSKFDWTWNFRFFRSFFFTYRFATITLALKPGSRFDTCTRAQKVPWMELKAFRRISCEKNCVCPNYNKHQGNRLENDPRTIKKDLKQK